VDNPLPGSQIRADDIHTDVKRDMRVGNIVLAVLIGLCVLGIVMAIGNTAIEFGARLSLIFISGAALLVLGCIAILRGRARQSKPSGACGTVFLVLGTIVAIAILGFITCSVGIRESLRNMH
jgi:hypothetical protein